ncbi:Peptidyl-prolyl cis-trans isomerase pin4 [Vanrija albida]|uniref:Peptidyl-prolyl cis-trans isomerase pin4 n=1 Tax=Vanrija albida TaxID=181172 RepID=A0ABR3QE33_9TREE
MNHQHSPPLQSLHAMSITPAPYGIQSEYPYNGVFGPPASTPTGGQPARGWTSSPKRGSRSGIPTAWFEPQPQSSSLNHPYDSFRRDASSPPTLSPPSSTTSGATSAQPYFPAFQLEPFGLAPSPPPQIGYGLATAGAAPGFNAGGLPPFGSQQLGAMPPRPTQWRTPYMPAVDDDVIPTAIVIKNIPFAVNRETLLAIIESLGAPLPYAFNYHHDNGIFRGLAFANFRAPEEAASVVAALNGYDVQGRKLRVEYKKVLQPGEKDRIEREKAIKRMKSMQIDAVAKSQAQQQQQQDAPPVPPVNVALQQQQSQQQHQQHQHQQLQQQVRANGHHPQFSFDGASDSPPHSATSNSSDNLPVALDLNDPGNLRIYNMVYMFKEDRMRDELALSRNLSPTERRIVHLVAQKLGLTSITKGDGDAKHVVVTKDTPPPTQQSSTTTSFLAPHNPDGNPAPGLRIKKSMPDLRGFNGPVVARDPARSLTPQRSSGNLRAEAAGGAVIGRDYSSMGASHGRRLNGHGLGSGTFNSFFGTPVGAPPVPPLPASLPDGTSLESSSQPLRNPRGPIGESRGFASGAIRPISSSLRGVPGALALGRRVSEEDEHDSATSRTREELDL